jgi:hypothetical protein
MVFWLSQYSPSQVYEILNMAPRRKPAAVSELKSRPRISMRLELSAQPEDPSRWALIILGVTLGFGLVVGGAYWLIEDERKPIAEVVQQLEEPQQTAPTAAEPPTPQTAVSAAPAAQPSKFAVGLRPKAVVPAPIGTPAPDLTLPSSLFLQTEPKPRAAEGSPTTTGPPKHTPGQVKF